MRRVLASWRSCVAVRGFPSSLLLLLLLVGGEGWRLVVVEWGSRSGSMALKAAGSGVTRTMGRRFVIPVIAFHSASMSGAPSSCHWQQRFQDAPNVSWAVPRAARAASLALLGISSGVSLELGPGLPDGELRRC